MTKTVHFSTTNTLYSPLPWTPSPGASTSSLPPSPSAATFPTQPESPPTKDAATKDVQEEPLLVSDGAFAPPAPIVYSVWPSDVEYAAFASPRPTSLAVPLPSPIHIHSLLSFTPHAPPNLIFDLAHPLAVLTPRITPAFLSPATLPPTPTLTLTSPHLSHAMQITPPHPTTPFVSVLDVLASLHTQLHTGIRRAEYDVLPAERRGAVDTAYFKRVAGLALVGVDEPGRKTEAERGVKWVDFLEGRTRFMGLSGPLVGSTHNVWSLNMV
ncbi:hypothetical protein R3P38DRAFT_2800634 [Favolaschia claudopus]|uniref:DUF6699 domain-containing protein n=1 Tax=Favolaschia claudopus TaxID=2862362 RepID=A0AAV9ZXB0_9AGAR